LLADPTALLAGALFLCAVLYSVQEIQRARGVDYYQFWVMSRAAASPASDSLYSVETSRQIGLEYLDRARSSPESSRFRDAAEWNQKTNPDVLDPISTPFYYALLGSIATGDYDRDYRIFQALGGVAFVLGLIGLCRIFAYPWPAALLAATLVLLWFGPLHSDVQAANVNRLQFAALVASLLLLRRNDARGFFLGGLALALLVLFKPNLAFVPVLLIATWAIQGRRRDLKFGTAGLAAGALLGFLVGSWFLRSFSSWPDWLGVTRRLLSKPYPIENFNVSLATLVYSNTGFDPSVWLTLGIVTSYCACLSRGVLRGDSDLLAIGVGCILPLIAVQIAWDHYFLLTLPLLLYFLRPESELLERLLAVAALLLIAQSPLNIVVPLQTAQQVAIGFAISTTTLLGLTLRAAYSRSRVSTSSSSR
jgi:hypothetical protein